MKRPEIYDVHEIPSYDGGYYRYPSISGDQVIFVSEDDLWSVPIAGGTARRLTATAGRVTSPMVSPCGKFVAYTSTEHGGPEVFVMAAGGGAPEKLTYSGARTAEVSGWSSDGESVIFRSNLREPFLRKLALYQVPRQGGEVLRMSIGDGHGIDFSADGDGTVLVRYSDDLARWKRYRGGMAGQIWIDVDGSGHWERLLPEITGGLCRPMWIDDRIFFITDEEGTANLYSCTTDGDDLQQHTYHEEHYIRFASHQGTSIVYTCAGDLYRFDVGEDDGIALDVDYPSPRTRLQSKFVDATDYLHDCTLHPEGHSLAITSRGKVFNFGNWEGGVRQTGFRHGVRYRLVRYIDDGNQLLVISDEGGEEHFEIHDIDGDGPTKIIDTGDIDPGRALEILIAPDGNQAIFTNHRFELLYLDINTGNAKLVDTSPAKRIAGIAWAPDSRHIAYGFFENHSTSVIKIADVKTGESQSVTTGEFRDLDPAFDPKGRYLYFLSYRHFRPVMDQMFLELSFPRGIKPCVITLNKSAPSIFVETPRPVHDDAHGEEDDELDLESFQIDFDGIADRVEIFPVSEGNYDDIQATEDRVFWTSFPLRDEPLFDDEPSGTLEYFDLDKKKLASFTEDIWSFSMDRQAKTLALWDGEEVRVVSAGGDPPEEDEGGDANRESGYIDLDRISVAVEPRAEWCQMLREAWRLMRDQFWRSDMDGVDWEYVWRRYKRLLPAVSARSEFSDLVWTMHGELGTSHAYEGGGDYDVPPQYQPGFLGADLCWEPSWQLEENPERFNGAVRVEQILRGAPGELDSSSPLVRPGVDVDEGDVILAVNGQKIVCNTSMGELLTHQAGREVELLIADGDGKGQPRSVTVKTMESEISVRYREWVDLNRRTVHEATKGRIGYVHVPDMGLEGFAEFHRQFLREHQRDGLIVDVRLNGGGFISQLILEKLARKPIGFEIMRHGTQHISYPADTVRGPLVAITNSEAGSDGDIFSNGFKLMELGPLIGMRTWGGTVGIFPRHELADGSVTTQPEFAFWFANVGYGLENHGAEPDIEVDFPPETEAGAGDPQLQTAIATIRELLNKFNPLTPPIETP